MLGFYHFAVLNATFPQKLFLYLLLKKQSIHGKMLIVSVQNVFIYFRKRDYMKPALIIGSTCVDIILNLDHLPVTAEDLHPHSQTMAIGGCAYNVSHILRLTETEHTFITPVGGGIYGDYVRKHFETNQIPIHVSLPQAENGCCYCFVEADGERTFLSCHGAEYTFREEWMANFPSADYGLTYVCGLEIEEPTGEQLISYLEKHPDLQIFYAPGPRGVLIDAGRMQRMFDLHPILHINEQEALQLSSENDFVSAAAALRKCTGNTVIITLGKQGTYCLEKDTKKEGVLIPSLHVTHITDTIGAGDAHAGALIAALTRDIPLADAISYANAVSAAVITVPGASLPPELLPPMPCPCNDLRNQ